jgi:hypothetical protein
LQEEQHNVDRQYLGLAAAQVDDGSKNHHDRQPGVLTEAGWLKIQETAPGHVREVRRLVIDTLTADQLRVLGESARQVLMAIDPHVAAALIEEQR